MNLFQSIILLIVSLFLGTLLKIIWDLGKMKIKDQDDKYKQANSEICELKEIFTQLKDVLIETQVSVKEVSQQYAVLLKFLLHEHNKNHGTTIKFEDFVKEISGR